MPETLLQTKLYIPPLRPNLVSRPRLIERLNKGLQLGHKLTLISAPAGFGKSTLVSEWVNKKDDLSSHPSPFILHPTNVAWLSLDERDNDPARFLAYLVAALQGLALSDDTIGDGALGLLQAAQPPAPEAVLTSLINDIVTIPDRFILILDDYHLINSAPIDDSLTFLLENLPPQMHLAIATRDDPHLPQARLRARGQLTELRAADLRFSSSEAAEFLNRAMGLDLTTADIAALESRTEGWIAGLQLAALALQGSGSIQGYGDATGLITSFTGSHRFVLDYLIEEVLEQQSATVQNFLLQTAILDRLTGSLGNALTGQDNGQATLEMLEQANLFVVPLDNERRWYRYHHLFADLLRQQLQQNHRDEIPLLHGRASEWFDDKGMTAESIHHALAGEDYQRAADLAEFAWPAMNQGIQAVTWQSWLKELPDEVVRARPVLCLGYAWAFLNSGQLEAAQNRLLDAERWLAPATELNEQPGAPEAEMIVADKEQLPSLAISLASARAYHAQATGDIPGTVKYAQQLLDLLPEGEQIYRRGASSLLGLTQYANGNLESAYQTFSDGLAGMDPHETITGTFVQAEIKMALGQLHAALHTCELSLQLVQDHGEPMPLGTEDVYTTLSKVHRERGNLELASQALLTARELGEKIELPDWQHRWCIAQARLKESQGDLDGALELLFEAERLFIRTPVPNVRPIPARKARVWVAQDRLREAQSWAQEQGLSTEDDLSYLREFEHITLARLLIARTKSDHVDQAVHQAMTLLERLLKAAEEGKRMASVIEILLLQALAHEAQGATPPALTSLERALTLAEPEGYLRLFVDEGPSLAHLLYEARSQGIAPEYTRRLLAAFPVTERVRPDSLGSTTANSELFEPLSDRELEVLQLIAEGLTNQEIATRLYISRNTVKVHTRNINGKLGVTNRMQAAARARGLGILTSP